VFHVEHTSLDLWKSWRRALRQRNALLRQGAPAAAFIPWEHDLGDLAERIHAVRARCLSAFELYLTQEALDLIPELGRVHVDYRPGWDIQVGLASQLAGTRARDMEQGFTRYGSHRADWSLVFAGVAKREHLSRGQAKAAALACTLALARWFKDSVGEYPVLCLDDVESELDAPHAALLIKWLHGKSIQSWLTSTRIPDAKHLMEHSRVFHVKHSGVESVKDFEPRGIGPPTL
jgi:DNA replication and repair protein RecF